MKVYSRVMLLVAAIWACMIAVFVGLTQSYRVEGTDPVFINDMVHTVRRHWGDLDTLDSGEFSDEMLIFDSNDFLIYSTAGKDLAEIRSVEEGMQRGCLCLAVAQDSRFLGTIVIPDPDKQHYDLVRQRLGLAAVIMSLVFLLTGGLYGLYVRRTIIVPPVIRAPVFPALTKASGSMDLMMRKISALSFMRASTQITFILSPEYQPCASSRVIVWPVASEISSEISAYFREKIMNWTDRRRTFSA